MPATAATPVHRPRVVVLDLDGVVWLSLQPIRGSAEAVAAMRAAGIEVLFATNNSAPRVADHEQALAAIGIPAEGCVITSAQAASMLVQPGAVSYTNLTLPTICPV